MNDEVKVDLTAKKTIIYHSEKDVKKQVKKLLDAHRYFWWMPPANGYGRAGIADILALRDGVFLAVETKFGRNKATAMQLGFLNSVQAEGGFAFIVDEKRVEFLKSWLEAFDRSTEAAKQSKPVASEDGAMMLNAMRELTREIPLG